MIVLPDIHGRDFWKDAVKGHENELIIFLGDYTDPYNYEGITKEKCLESIKEVIAFKKEHPDNVILLLGNHDLSYIYDRAPQVRYDYLNAGEINKLFINNIELFQITYTKEINGKRYLFSHSGLMPEWYRWHERNEEIAPIELELMPEKINEMFKNDREHICKWLSDVSPERGGSYSRCSGLGSCIWGGISELYSYLKNPSYENFTNTLQIVGHTQLRDTPVNERNFVCLDVRRGFILDEESGEITEMNGKIVKPKMKDVLVVGSEGQLGQEITNRYQLVDKNNAYHFTTYDGENKLDITDYDSIEKYVEKLHIDYIVNCAAYTNVDKAEEDYDSAYDVNVKGVENLAKICKKYDIKLIHISTDYVFDGEKNEPYKVDDATNPINNYGLTKWLGEQAIRDIGCDALIIRTSWLYSLYGNNFVKKMIELFNKNETVKVVSDQFGSPTNAMDLADFILTVLSDGNVKNETVQFSNIGEISWYDFAKKIYEYAIGFGNSFKCNQIVPCNTDEFKTIAKRPYYSVMDKSKIKELFNYDIPNWENSLRTCLLYMNTFNYL